MERAGLVLLFLLLPGGVCLARPPGGDDGCRPSGEFRFSSPVRYRVGRLPHAVSAADVDGDGLVDLVTVSRSETLHSRLLSVLKGTPTGAFLPPRSLDIGMSNLDNLLATADMDGDGRDDAIVTVPTDSNPPWTMALYRGEADGTLEPADQLEIAHSPSAIDTGDLDGDGDVDVILTIQSSHQVMVAENDGSGSLRARRGVLTGNPPTFENEPNLARAADLDGDGIEDLLVAESEGLWLARGRGRLFYLPPERVADMRPRVLELGDLDGDGDVDIASGGIAQSGFRGELRFFLNDSRGGFRAVAAAEIAATAISLGLGDFDLDGDPDPALLWSSGHGVSIYRNDAGAEIASEPALSGGQKLRGVVVADLDGDGDIDVAAADEGSNDVFLWKSLAAGPFAGCGGSPTPNECELAPDAGDCNGNGRPDRCDLEPWLDLAARTIIPTQGPVPSLDVADLDGDDRPDLIVAQKENTGPSARITVHYNRGPGRFEPPVVVSPSAPPYSVRAADIDADGVVEIVALLGGPTSTDGRLQVFRGDGRGGFQAEESSIPVIRGARLVGGDLDGDDDPDFVITAAGQRIQVLRNSGDLLVAEEPIAFDPTITSVAIADLDGDGRGDLAAGALGGRNRSEEIEVLLASGEGFAPAASLPVQRAVNAVVAGDFDGDGDLDLVSVNSPKSSIPAPGSISLFRNRGDGTFETPARVDTGRFGHQAATGDLDGDGRLDLAVLSDDGVTILLARDGGLRLAATFQAGRQRLGASLELADLNGDDTLDLVVPSALNRALYLIANRGEAAFAAPEVLAGPRGTWVIFARDLDGDGDQDLISAEGGEAGSDRTGLRVFRNDGEGRFRPEAVPSYEKRPESYLAGDFDADGSLDILNLNGALWRGDGGGGFWAPEVVPLGIDPTRLRAYLSADLDGDRDSDLVLSFQVGGLHVLINERGATSFRHTEYSDRVANGPIALVDVEGDGDVDIAALSSSPEFGLAVLANQGDGTFVEGEFSPVFLDLGFSAGRMTAGDLDGDGKTDFCGSLGSSTLFVLPGQGGGRVADPILYSMDAAGAPVIADVDQDGDRDLLVSSGRGFSVRLNRGGGELAPPYEYQIGGRATSLLVLDLDPSGRKDLAWVDTSSRLVSVLRDVSSPPVSEDLDADGIPDECEGPSFHRGDANDDGKLDIADAIFVILQQLFAGEAPTCADAADGNDDGRVDIADPIWLLLFLYREGPPPPDPGSPSSPCGRDPGGDEDSAGCDSYTSC